MKIIKILNGKILKETEYYCLYNKKFYPVDVSTGDFIIKFLEKHIYNMTIIKGKRYYNDDYVYIVKDKTLCVEGYTLKEAVSNYKKQISKIGG